MIRRPAVECQADVTDGCADLPRTSRGRKCRRDTARQDDNAGTGELDWFPIAEKLRMVTLIKPLPAVVNVEVLLYRVVATQPRTNVVFAERVRRMKPLDQELAVHRCQPAPSDHQLESRRTPRAHCERL